MQLIEYILSAQYGLSTAVSHIAQEQLQIQMQNSPQSMRRIWIIRLAIFFALFILRCW
jgi:hypothetical protein